MLPVLETLGERIFRTGPLGSGHAMKALNNFLGATAYTAAAEALAIGKEFGLDPAVMLDVVNTSTGRSFNTEVVFKNDVITGRYGTGFALGLLAKDVGIAAGLAESVGVHAPACELVGAGGRRRRRGWASPPTTPRRTSSGGRSTSAARSTTTIRRQRSSADRTLACDTATTGVNDALVRSATDALADLIDRDQDFRLIGTGYGFTEGPAWNPAGQLPDVQRHPRRPALALERGGRHGAGRLADLQGQRHGATRPTAACWSASR